MFEATNVKCTYVLSGNSYTYNCAVATTTTSTAVKNAKHYLLEAHPGATNIVVVENPTSQMIEQDDLI